MTTAPASTGLQPGDVCPGEDMDMGMVGHQTCTHPEGATLWLGGTAWAHPTVAQHLQPIDTVHNYPGNPRRADQAQITGSVRDLGFYGTVQAQASSGAVLVGNHRLRTLTDLGAVLAPVQLLAVGDERAAAIVARDNYTSDQATNDPTELLALLKPLDDAQLLALSGYDDQAMLLLARQAEAAEAFTIDHSQAVDEFVAITGEDGGEVQRVAHRTVLFAFRDEAAVKDFETKLGFTMTAEQRQVRWPRDWKPKPVEVYAP